MAAVYQSIELASDPLKNIFETGICANISRPAARAALMQNPKRVCANLRNINVHTIEVVCRSEETLVLLDKVIRPCEAEGTSIIAGSVTRKKWARRIADTGVKGFIGPNYRPEVGKVARKFGLPYVPGVATPTEMGEALDDGWGTLKIYPALIPKVLADMRLSVCSLYEDVDVRLIASTTVKPSDPVALWKHFRDWHRPGEIADALIFTSELFPNPVEPTSTDEWWGHFIQKITEFQKNMKELRAES